MSNVIKTAEEILDKYPNYTDNGGIGRGFAKEAMMEFAKQFIDLAADKAFINVTHGHDDWEELNNDVSEGRIKIDKESILKVKQLIK